jgi:hypothetical protein
VEVARWITYTQAASILDCHFSNVAKLIRTGDLTSTGQRSTVDHPTASISEAERPSSSRLLG